MDKHFELKIITPGGKAWEGAVSSVTCPGTLGRFQVLFNHAPMLSSLEIGSLTFAGDTGTVTYAVSGGFAQIFHNSVLILAETAERAETIDIGRAEEARKRAEERLQHRKEIDVARAELALRRAINRIKVAGTR